MTEQALGTLYLPRRILDCPAGTPVTIISALKRQGKVTHVDLRTSSGTILSKVPIDLIEPR